MVKTKLVIVLEKTVPAVTKKKTRLTRLCTLRNSTWTIVRQSLVTSKPKNIHRNKIKYPINQSYCYLYFLNNNLLFMIIMVSFLSFFFLMKRDNDKTNMCRRATPPKSTPNRPGSDNWDLLTAKNQRNTKHRFSNHSLVTNNKPR